MPLVLATATEPGIGRTTSLLNAAVRISSRGANNDRPVVYVELDEAAPIANSCLALWEEGGGASSPITPRLEQFLSSSSSSAATPLPRNVANASSLSAATRLNSLWVLARTSTISSLGSELDALAWTNRVLFLLEGLMTRSESLDWGSESTEEPLFIVDLPSFFDSRGFQILNSLISADSTVLRPDLLLLFHTWRIFSIRRAREVGRKLRRNLNELEALRFRLVGTTRLHARDEFDNEVVDGAITLELAAEELASELLQSFRRFPVDIPFDPALYLQPLVFPAADFYFADRTASAFDALSEGILSGLTL